MQDTIMQVLSVILNIYMYLMVFYILSSWIPGLRENALGKFVGKLVQPYLGIFRFIPPIGMIDISPIIAIFAYSYLSHFLLVGIAEVLNFIM